MEYDEVIIGAGMAGLYYVHKTKPKNFIILEKLNRIGGRVYNKMWNGHQISLGGGVIKSSNTLAIELATSLGLELASSISKYHMVDLVNKTCMDKDTTLDTITDMETIANLNKTTKEPKEPKESKEPNENNFYEYNKVIIKYLKKLYRDNETEIRERKLTWNEFLDLYLGLGIADTIKSNLLYQTYTDADPYSVLNYEIDELLRTEDFEIKYIKNSGYTILLEKLIDEIGIKNIRLCTTVSKITQENNLWKKIYFGNNQFIKAKKIILATEASTKIVFDLNTNICDKLNQLYGMVGGSEYIRIYSYHSNTHGLTYSYRTSGLPGKVILINKNILMCCYTEEIPAIKLLELLKKNTKETQLEIIYKLLRNCGIPITKPDDILIKFWNLGVHFNKPEYNQEIKLKLLGDLKNEGIIVIGEAIANTHGWVNSAFESVETVVSL